MAEKCTIISERVDDRPRLLAHQERMGIHSVLDEHVPTHGNGVGLSLGWVTVIWLTPILSEADHRLNHVEPWAAPRLQTLRGCTGQRVHPLAVSDDHLGAVLEALSDDARWSACEGTLNQPRRRVYDVQLERVRLDSPTASGYWRVTEDGRFQLGHSQDQRPDLPQVKVLLSALDPLGIPIATDVVPGQRADEPLYIPAMARVRGGVGQQGLWSVGDCKMGALETRAFVQAGGDDYRCPLSERQVPPPGLAASLAPVGTGEPALTPIARGPATGQHELIAEGVERVEPLTASVGGVPLSWAERRLVIRSHQLAPAGDRGLRARLAKAQAAIAALNERRRGKRRVTERTARPGAVAAIVARAHVQGLLQGRYEDQGRQRPVRRDGERPATVRVEQEWPVTASVDEEAVGAAVRQRGWRVYATNPAADHLSLEPAVLAYRSAYLIEQDVGRLQGRPLSLTPMDLERDDHATGLIRLLSIGLRVLTRLEFVVRQRLAAAHMGLAGLYAGNPKRTTARPTTERLLKRFQGLTLTIIREGRRRRYHLTPLSRVPRRILALLNFPVDIYTRLCPHSHPPP